LFRSDVKRFESAMNQARTPGSNLPVASLSCAGIFADPEPNTSTVCLPKRGCRPENVPPGAAMKIAVNDQVHLSEFQASDKPRHGGSAYRTSGCSMMGLRH